jgi:peptide/nickel transport system substrate-binding protein
VPLIDDCIGRGSRLAFGAALATALLLGAPPAHAAKSDNSVRFVAYTTLDSADPYFTNARLGVILADSVWDTLIFRNPRTGAYEGNLATAWRWVDDTTLELELREGVRFHNGAPFDADDVAYTLSFMADAANKAMQQSLVRWIERVEKRDARTVRIVTKGPFPAAIAMLAAPMVAIFPHEYYARVGQRGMNAAPIGSGPFRVVEHALGKAITLERNPDYFTGGPKSRPAIDRVAIRFVSDAQTRVAEMVSGGADLDMYVARDQAEQLRDIEHLQIVAGDTLRYTYLALNTLASTPAPALRDPRVRRAIVHAIDRDTIVSELVGGGARVLHVVCHPAQFGCDDSRAPRYAYDPRLARQLLSEAGYPAGFSLDLSAIADARHRNSIEAIIGYLAAVGVRARPRSYQSTALLDRLRSGRIAMAYTTWGSSSVFDVSASTSRYFEHTADDVTRDAEVRDLLVRGDSATDAAARSDSYRRALGLIAERAYAVPLYSQPVYYVANKDLVFTAYTDEIPHFWEMRYR